MQHRSNGETKFKLIFIGCMSKLEFPVAQDLQYRHDVVTISSYRTFFFGT